MITLLETQNFRMLRSNSVALRPFHVLVGQNATGKSTFLGALQFMADLLSGGLEQAVESVAPSFYDLCFWPDRPIALAVELSIPPSINHPGGELRYEVEVGIDPSEGLRVLRENLFKLPEPTGEPTQLRLSLFGKYRPILTEKPPRRWRKIVSKTKEGRDYFRDEKTAWNNMFRFGVGKAALGSLPEDLERFPLSIAVRDVLRGGVRMLALDTRKLRRATPPGGKAKLAVDGSNLPDVVQDFQTRDPVLFDQWIQHVSMAVSGLRGVQVRERGDDKHLVLEAIFEGEHETPVPSWMLSDGTLRLMALTLLSYAAQENGLEVYLIEEPENGLHPLAIQVAFEALSAPIGHGQFLCATHSPIFLAHTRLENALVFRRSEEGYAIVRRGPEVPELRDWAERSSLPDLFVTGVLESLGPRPVTGVATA